MCEQQRAGDVKRSNSSKEKCRRRKGKERQKEREKKRKEKGGAKDLGSHRVALPPSHFSPTLCRKSLKSAPIKLCQIYCFPAPRQSYKISASSSHQTWGSTSSSFFFFFFTALQSRPFRVQRVLAKSSCLLQLLWESSPSGRSPQFQNTHW